VVEGSAGGGVDLLIIKQPVKSAKVGGLTIGTPHLAIETSKSVSHIIDTRVDTRIDPEFAYYGTSSFIDTRVDAESGYHGSFYNDIDYRENGRLSRRKRKDTDANLLAAGPVGYWLKPFVGHSKQKNTGNVPGYTADTYGLIMGADREYNDWLVGFAASLAHSKAEGQGANKTTTTLVEGTLYGSRKLGKGILNLQFGLGYLANKRTRFATIEGQDVKADYDGYLIQAKAIYERPLALSDNALLYPYISAELVHAKNDEYREKGPGTAVEKVSAVSNNSAVLSVGLKGKYKLSKRSSLVGNIGVGYDFGSKKQKYRAQYIAAGLESVIYGNKPGKFEYNLGVGYQTITKGGTRVKFMIDHKGRRDYHDTTGSVKIHLPFN